MGSTTQIKGRYVIKEGKNKENKSIFHINLLGGNSRIIATSETHNTKQECLEEIELIKLFAPISGNYYISESKDGHPYFVLRFTDADGDKVILLTSQMYESIEGCRVGIKSVIKNCLSETITYDNLES